MTHEEPQDSQDVNNHHKDKDDNNDVKENQRKNVDVKLKEEPLSTVKEIKKEELKEVKKVNI